MWRMVRSVQAYDRLGASYADSRRPDPSIARRVEFALGGATAVVNVGAGTGSYEPQGLQVVAVEPSMVMVRQRPRGAAPVVRAIAEALPFPEKAFDAAMAILTIHHWSNCQKGLAEMSPRRAKPYRNINVGSRNQ